MLHEASHEVVAAAADPLVVMPPNLDHAQARRIAEQRFGIRGTISDLGGERDQNLRLDAEDGHSYVVKISNPADAQRTIDLQVKALRHVAEQDPSLPLMRVVRSLTGHDWTVTTGTDDGAEHLLRLFTLVPGRRATAEELDREALHDYGVTVGRMARALRGFFHPAARYDILWDLRHTAQLRPLLDVVPPGSRRTTAQQALDGFDARIGPRFEGLRAQVLHNDLTLDNVLLDDHGRVNGVLDVGDLTHTAVVADLAIALTAVMSCRADPIEAAQEVIAGYVSVASLEDDEAHLLADLIQARLAAWGMIAAWRVAHHPDNATYITAGEDDAWDLLAHLQSLDPEVVRRHLRAAARRVAMPYRSTTTPDLARRRPTVLGMQSLSYHEPLHLVAGEGVWLFAADGRRYLDAYNNVPVVGHANPRVSMSISGQSHTLATNSRYLHEAAVTLAERLVATMPDGLDTVLFVNSGSEANDLAWRMATTMTGRSGAITSAHAYHGLTDATAALSPEEWPAGFRPAHVETFTPAPPGHDGYDGGTSVGHAIAALTSRGLEPAAMILDPGLTSDGILVPPPDELRQQADAVRAAEGLLIIDEVQTGHGRCGSHLWGFRSAGITPDIVTLGKPMGNGHPIAAVVTRSDIAATLMGRSELFSTFGGNPVSCVAALTVLDVIQDEDLLQQSVRVGEHLQRELRTLADRHEQLGEVRGRGLLIGVDVLPEGSSAADPSRAPRAQALINGLRQRGVLIGTTGPNGDVLKIRPPLIFETSHADLLVNTLDDVLAHVGSVTPEEACPDDR